MKKSNMLKSPGTSSIPSQGGFVIIDVLMAILLFSLGILGLVGLQTAMARSQLDAKVRADASYLAGELIAQIWANSGQITSYTASGCASYSPCKEWQDKVASTLPSGVGSVTPGSSSGDITVTITWVNPSGEQHKYTTETTVVR